MPELTPHTLGKFCREIAVGLSPLQTLLSEWGLTPDTYERLRDSPGYKHEMAVIAQEIQELGPDAGYIYRMKSLSEEFLKEIVKIMESPDTSVGTRVDLIKFCAEMGRLKEKPPTGNKNGVDFPRGPSVIFQFGDGLPVKSIQVHQVEEGDEPRPVSVQEQKLIDLTTRPEPPEPPLAGPNGFPT